LFLWWVQMHVSLSKRLALSTRFWTSEARFWTLTLCTLTTGSQARAYEPLMCAYGHCKRVYECDERLYKYNRHFNLMEYSFNLCVRFLILILSTTITRWGLLRSWVLFLRVKKLAAFPSFMFILSITLPNLSIPDVPFPALLSTLIRRRFQVCIPPDPHWSYFFPIGGGVLRYSIPKWLLFLNKCGAWWTPTRTTTNWPAIILGLPSLFLEMSICRLMYHGISILICPNMLCAI